jgi:hypothetical protein
MAYNTHVSLSSWDLALNAILSQLNGGYIEVFSGPQPATPDVPVDGQTLLVTLSLAADAFGDATEGTATANAITPGVAVAAGTAAWFRAYESDGATAVIDGSVGTSDADMVLSDLAISVGGTVAVSSWTVSCAPGQ